MHDQCEPIPDLVHAAKLIQSVHPDEPWVTIINGPPDGDHIYFQVLGRPDEMVVEGGVRRNGVETYWRATARPRDESPAIVGPHWYKIDCWRSDVLTVHDALAMLVPALSDTSGDFSGVPGLDAVWW